MSKAHVSPKFLGKHLDNIDIDQDIESTRPTKAYANT